LRGKKGDVDGQRYSSGDEVVERWRGMRRKAG
jgi:hypothetical protein